MNRSDWIRQAPEGWRELVTELDAELSARWPDYTIEQLKEKFGTLRFYANPGIDTPDFPDTKEGRDQRQQWRREHTEEFCRIISNYETRSGETCDQCGNPGTLGDRDYWWSTRCDTCAPAGWVALNNPCTHPSITNETCDTCGRTRLARLEHSTDTARGTHQERHCAGGPCALHNRTDHPMRHYPQHWNSDYMVVERTCSHGQNHPDPDEFTLHAQRAHTAATPPHTCDGCCP